LELVESNPVGVRNVLDVFQFSTIEDATSVVDGEIIVSFTYLPNFELITTYLQQWEHDIFFQLVIEIDYALTGSKKRVSRDEKGVAAKEYKSFARIQVPLEGLEQNEPKSKSRKLRPKSSSFALVQSDVHKILDAKKNKQEAVKEEDELEKEVQEIKSKLEVEKSQEGDLIFYATGTGVAMIFSIFIVVAIVLRKRSEEQNRFDN